MNYTTVIQVFSSFIPKNLSCAILNSLNHAAVISFFLQKTTWVLLSSKNILLTLQVKDIHSGKAISIKNRLSPGFECKTKSHDWNFHNMIRKEFSAQ